MWTALSILPLLAPQSPGPADLYATLSEVERVTPEVLVVQAVTPAVAFIETEYTQRVRTIFGGTQNRKRNGSGSGVVIHPDGYIVTNYHVVRGARSITASFQDRIPYKAELVSFVQSEDLALLKIEARPPLRATASAIGNQLGPAPSEAGFQAVRLGTSVDLMQGERVVAIGSPYGQTHTVSTGIISGLHRNVNIPEQNLHFQGLIQTDASINFGNSGGPLLNVRGELIGINSAMNTQAENIGFAIPVDRVLEVLNGYLYPQAIKSWMGFEVATDEELTTPSAEVLVTSVCPGGPAELVGICPGDRIVRVGEESVANAEEYVHASLQLVPGQEVPITVERNGAEEVVTIESWAKLDGVIFERLGITVREERGRDQTYVIVDKIGANGPGAQIGLQPGDWIPAIRPHVDWIYGPLRIRDKSLLYDVVSRLKPEDVADIDIYRDVDGDRMFARDELYKGKFKVR